MRRIVIATSLISILLFLGPPPAMAEQPDLVEQLVYALEVFDGVGLSSTFVPESENTIYMIADHPSAVSPRRTMVYYWPITQSYKADWETLNESAEAGSLEILQGRKVIQVTETTIFSVVFHEGYGSRKAELYWGIEAKEIYQSYLEQRDAYFAEFREYQSALREYERAYDEYQDAMLDEDVIEKPPMPIQPEELEPFVMVATPLIRGYKIDLPEGSYRIRLLDEDGQIIPKSEKKLDVFSHRRTGIGYNIIPESRWTKPERSDDPEGTIYVKSGSDASLYLQPFYQAEFNEAKYRGLLDPQDHSGDENRWVWAHLGEYEGGILALTVPESSEEFVTIEEKPFQVVQMPGPTLGYQVVEYDPEIAGGQRPTFTGFELDLEKQSGRLDVQLLDSGGDLVEGSEREVRWIPSQMPVVQYLWVGLPLLVGFIVFFIRRSTVQRMKKESNAA